MIYITKTLRWTVYYNRITWPRLVMDVSCKQQNNLIYHRVDKMPAPEVVTLWCRYISSCWRDACTGSCHLTPRSADINFTNMTTCLVLCLFRNFRVADHQPISPIVDKASEIDKIISFCHISPSLAWYYMFIYLSFIVLVSAMRPSSNRMDYYDTLCVDHPQSLGAVRCAHAPFILSILLPIYRAKLPNSKRIVLVPKCYV